MLKGLNKKNLTLLVIINIIAAFLILTLSFLPFLPKNVPFFGNKILLFFYDKKKPYIMEPQLYTQAIPPTPDIRAANKGNISGTIGYGTVSGFSDYFNIIRYSIPESRILNPEIEDFYASDTGDPSPDILSFAFSLSGEKDISLLYIDRDFFQSVSHLYDYLYRTGRYSRNLPGQTSVKNGISSVQKFMEEHGIEKINNYGEYFYAPLHIRFLVIIDSQSDKDMVALIKRGTVERRCTVFITAKPISGLTSELNSMRLLNFYEPVKKVWFLLFLAFLLLFVAESIIIYFPDFFSGFFTKKAGVSGFIILYPFLILSNYFTDTSFIVLLLLEIPLAFALISFLRGFHKQDSLIHNFICFSHFLFFTGIIHFLPQSVISLPINSSQLPVYSIYLFNIIFLYLIFAWNHTFPSGSHTKTGIAIFLLLPLLFFIAEKYFRENIPVNSLKKFLEVNFYIRPRLKEIAGWFSLFYLFVYRSGKMAAANLFRMELRAMEIIGVFLSFLTPLSIVNSFLHFSTPFYITLLRTGTGIITGFFIFCLFAVFSGFVRLIKIKISNQQVKTGIRAGIVIYSGNNLGDNFYREFFKNLYRISRRKFIIPEKNLTVSSVRKLLLCDELYFIGGIWQDKTSFFSFAFYYFLLLMGKLSFKKILFLSISVEKPSYKITGSALKFFPRINYLWARDNYTLDILRDKADHSFYCGDLAVTSGFFRNDSNNSKKITRPPYPGCLTVNNFIGDFTLAGKSLYDTGNRDKTKNIPLFLIFYHSGSEPALSLFIRNVPEKNILMVTLEEEDYQHLKKNRAPREIFFVPDPEALHQLFVKIGNEKIAVLSCRLHSTLFLMEKNLYPFYYTGEKNIHYIQSLKIAVNNTEIKGIFLLEQGK